MSIPSNPCTQSNILIVDDTPDNLRVLSLLLTQQGYEVRKALTGEMAIASAQADPPDLILLDIKMPGMDGYQVCEHLRADPLTRQVPVIFISALGESRDKVTAFSVGGVDYITKPFQAPEVLARIENQLRLRQLQQQLMLQNAELERSNRDLEDFAHVVSHDLQQPLQSVTGFADLLLLKYGDRLDATAVEYIECIANSGKRMQRLIRDLLNYAQVGSENQQFLPIDCNQVIHQVFDNLRGTIYERGVSLTHDPLPTVWGHETQLVQLFQNLIGNAIKFIRPGADPEVVITATRQGHSYEFQIRDNGIGIAPEHLERVFQVFQRGHQDESEYVGTGIGLATCKKIVEGHGGRIWVESELGVGTTFFFTLTEPGCRL
jgi:signal transduction histidine kinase